MILVRKISTFLFIPLFPSHTQSYTQCTYTHHRRTNLSFFSHFIISFPPLYIFFSTHTILHTMHTHTPGHTSSPDAREGGIILLGRARTQLERVIHMHAARKDSRRAILYRPEIGAHISILSPSVCVCLSLSISSLSHSVHMHAARKDSRRAILYRPEIGVHIFILSPSVCECVSLSLYIYLFSVSLCPYARSA